MEEIIVNLSGTFGATLVSCANHEIPPDDNNGSFKDIEILDQISKRANDAFLEY